ncbi:MAG: enoyl-CoA hydratase/isomerase family protein [Pseudomonadota bacterium]
MSDLLVRTEGCAGRITLNRPKALNAVTWDMVREIDRTLQRWAADDAVALVIIDAAGDRAFAAGGDIVDLYHASRAGDLDFGRRFWTEEYRLNLTMAEYPKPIVSLMQGFTMGGGVGLSCHVSHRVVDETVQLALPECGIGLIPDVGSSWLLAKAPRNFGVFLGLTGYRMGPDDAIFAGLADIFVPRESWARLIKDLCADGDVTVLEQVAVPPPEGALSLWAETSQWFRAETLPEIADDLAQVGASNADKWRKALHTHSPLALHCALNTIRAAKDLTLREAFAQEYRFSYRAVQRSDFLEGIRAQVIDKDRQPKWKHTALKDVNPEDVAAMLAPLGDDEWTFERNER